MVASIVSDGVSLVVVGACGMLLMASFCVWAYALADCLSTAHLESQERMFWVVALCVCMAFGAGAFPGIVYLCTRRQRLEQYLARQELEEEDRRRRRRSRRRRPAYDD